MGQYTQVDPIGLAGGNPTLYGYVRNTLLHVDIFGLYSLFRAIFENEIRDILATGMVRNMPSMGYETGKLFATTHSDAVRFGNMLSRFESNPNFRILEVNVPDNVNVTRFTADGMPAVAVDNADLSQLEIVNIRGCG